jgi:hypothetical protein
VAHDFGRWFRFYDGVLDDPKVQRLPDKLFRAWVNLMCLASRRGGRVEADYADLAFSLRISEGEARETLQALASAGLMDIEDDTIEPHNWTERQFKSDVTDPTAAERMRRKRATDKDRNTVTAPLRSTSVTVTATREEKIQNREDTDSEAKASAVASAPASEPLVFKTNLQKRSFDLGDSLGIARPAVGSMAKKSGYDWTAVHDVLSRCKATSPADPTSWCMAEFQPKAQSPPPKKPGLAERLTAKIGA